MREDNEESSHDSSHIFSGDPRFAGGQLRGRLVRRQFHGSAGTQSRWSRPAPYTGGVPTDFDQYIAPDTPGIHMISTPGYTISAPNYPAYRYPAHQPQSRLGTLGEQTALNDMHAAESALDQGHPIAALTDTETVR